ncbi:MAG: hypothetical protein ACREND_10580 [Gemmatimonadaceae bacterium]
MLTTKRDVLDSSPPARAVKRGVVATVLGIAAALLLAACQSPTAAAHPTPSAAMTVHASTTTGQSFSVHAGTLTSSGGFITGNQSFLPCGADTIPVDTVTEIPPISATSFCGPPTLETQGGVELDGGFVSVDYATPLFHGSVAPDIEGNWKTQVQFFFPTGVSAVITATPYGGYHLASWTINGPNGSRNVDSLTIVRPANSTDNQYTAFFQQGAGSGGTGGTGGGIGGGSGGRCLHDCQPPG